jgi:hypothetical protein
MDQRPDPDPAAGRSAEHRPAETLAIELPAALAAALDRLVERDHPELTRAEAMVAAFRDFASAHGLVATTDEGLRPDELNASNDG